MDDIRQLQELEWLYGADAEVQIERNVQLMLARMRTTDDVRARRAMLEHFLNEDFHFGSIDADEVLLLPIYPAREEPIPGVESEMIGRLLTVPWTICDRAELAEKVAAMDTDVVVSFGAGNIDACCGALAEKLREKA